MTGTLLRFYVHENRRHEHVLLYDWLLGEAKKLGIRGGSAFRAIGGFGRQVKPHSAAQTPNSTRKPWMSIAARECTTTVETT